MTKKENNYNSTCILVLNSFSLSYSVVPLMKESLGVLMQRIPSKLDHTPLSLHAEGEYIAHHW